VTASPSGVVDIGLERVLASPPSILQRRRFGLLMNDASVDRRFRSAARLLADAFPGQLVALFSPQHGLWHEEQDNMIESTHGFDVELGVPIYSLYGETREPTPEMFDGLEALVVDLQDVGTRVYTFVWTMSYCLEACARRRIPVVVLDRPNPLGGERAAGPQLEPGFESFVGRAALPMAHGLTLAELALQVDRMLGIGADILPVAMVGWHRAMRFPQTGRAWLPPSPNLPRFEGVDVYPGTVLFEGTNLSEGRGTTTPFEVIGARSSSQLGSSTRFAATTSMVWCCAKRVSGRRSTNGRTSCAAVSGCTSSIRKCSTRTARQSRFSLR